ncbi:MAG: hypothetical protein EBS85_04080 [Micrococcales bacterium]|nr:hypothetical protein [Actinomycetota bacterium]NCA07888.1 hypothetical protein [Micrococcales bacterium]
MNLLTLLPKTATDEPTAISTSPGIIGWIFTFFLAVAALALIADMVRRIRKIRYREEILLEISEEEAAKEEAAELARQKANKNSD